MASSKLIVLALCIVSAFCHPDGGLPGGKEKFMKMIKCGKDTEKLGKECCPMPKFDELKNDPECKSHLDGIDEKEGMEKGKAYSCFMDCIFKAKGLIEGRELKWDEIRKHNDEFLGTDSEFKEVSAKAIDFCENKGKTLS